MKQVYRTVITLTVYSQDPELPKWDIVDILRDADEGLSIGMASVTLANEAVSPDQIKPALLAIGNDGTFFDNLYDDEEGEEE